MPCRRKPAKAALDLQHSFKQQKLFKAEVLEVIFSPTYWIKDQHPAKEMNCFVCSLTGECI